jgi:peptidyl-dipeptidase A
MMLYLNEQSPEQILKLFDELDQLTSQPFAEIKGDIDQALAKKYGVAMSELYPWHYQDPFFQEPPAVSDVDLDAPFVKADIQKVCRTFYDGIGLPIDDVLSRSDLYEKAGKSPHAFCTDIDRKGDVRVLANIVSNEYWMSTMLHELGHAVYSSKNIPRELPYALRTDAHILATEGMAMMFERFAGNSKWLAAMGIEVSEPKMFDEAAAITRKHKLLIFSRWCQVMFRFEKGMYENPDQDLNQLWWELVSKYQLLRQPPNRSASDYASKIHIITNPVYYHNYLMGELFACQLHAALAKDLYQSDRPSEVIYWNDKKVGKYLYDQVFVLGKSLPWPEMVERSTGKPLGSQAFAAELSK